jgi:hypothetical protein
VRHETRQILEPTPESIDFVERFFEPDRLANMDATAAGERRPGLAAAVRQRPVADEPPLDERRRCRGQPSAAD